MKVLDILTSPWAIEKEKLLEIHEIYSTHLRGEKIDIAAIEALQGKPMKNEPQGFVVQDGVAVIPIEGVIAKRMNLFSRISGGVSTQLLENDIANALGDPSVHSIVLSVDSPGGSVDGVAELASIVRAARDKKPIVALADGLMASAAFWIGSAASRIFITGETTRVGSIGVIATHVDSSKAAEQRGIRVTEITAGKFKATASENKPLSDEGRAIIQDMVDHIYSAFVTDVAANRGVSVEKVLQDMADGRVFLGSKAIVAGLVDGVSTLSGVIAMLNAERAAAVTGAVTPGNKKQAGGKMITEENAGFTVIIGGVECKTQADIDGQVKALDTASFDRGVTEGKATGAADERKRIQAVESCALPGHEKLVAELKFDGQTSGEQAAAKVLAAEQKKNGTTLAALKEDAPTAAPTSAAETTAADQKKPEAPKVIAQKAQQYQAEQKAKGITVSTGDAVKHVSAQEKQ